MRDPIEDLKSFSDQGLTMTPMPAAEVRRRGDRMRRRNTAMAAVGGIAAVITAIATPLAVVANQDHTPDRPPVASRPAVAWQQEIPAGFPITDGIGGTDPEPADKIKEGGAELGVEELTFCGKPAWSPVSNDPVGPPVDVLGAEYAEPGTEGINQRTLALYADGPTAERAFTALRTAVDDCPESTTEHGDTRLLEAVESDLAAEQSFVFLQTFRSQGEEYVDGTLSVFQVARTGNALLLTESHSMAAGDDALVQDQVQRDGRYAAPVVSAMGVFGGNVAPEADPSTTAAAATATIPDSFPLLDGYPTTDEGGDYGRIGPSRDLEPIVPEACGSTVELPEHSDLMRAGYRNPEDDRERQLVTFADEQSAEQYLQVVLDLHRSCLEVKTGNSGDDTQLTQVIDSISDIGDSAGGAVSRHEQFGAPRPGMTILVVVRVGTAVLLATESNEGGAGPDPAGQVQEEFNRVLTESEGVVRAMRGL